MIPIIGAKIQDTHFVKNCQWELTRASSCLSQAEFSQKTFGGSGLDYGQCIQQTSDGGYIVAGVTEPKGPGTEDVYLL